MALFFSFSFFLRDTCAQLTRAEFHAQKGEIPDPPPGGWGHLSHEACLPIQSLPPWLSGWAPAGVKLPQMPSLLFHILRQRSTAKVPFQLSFPISCSLTDKLLRRGKREGAEVGKTEPTPLLSSSPQCCVWWGGGQRPGPRPSLAAGTWLGQATMAHMLGLYLRVEIRGRKFKCQETRKVCFVCGLGERRLPVQTSQRWLIPWAG